MLSKLDILNYLLGFIFTIILMSIIKYICGVTAKTVLCHYYFKLNTKNVKSSIEWQFQFAPYHNVIESFFIIVTNSTLIGMIKYLPIQLFKWIIILDTKMQ